MSENKRRKRKRKYKGDDEPKGKVPYRGGFYNPLRGRLTSRRGGGGRSKPSRYIKHHDFKYQPEPKDKPKPERLNWSSKVEPWTEPKQPKPERVVVRTEPDAQELLKELESHPELYEKLIDQILEKMGRDFRDQAEAMGVKDYGELSQEEAEKIAGEIIENNPSRDDEPIENPHEISGSLFYDSMAGSVPRKDAEAQSENVETEEKQGEMPTEIEPTQEVEQTEEEESSTDVIEQLENQDLSELEAEIFPPETDSEKEPEVSEIESELPEPLPETEPLPEIVEPEEEEEAEV